ncbi:MAG: hypothetical protein JWR69_3560 [Pedosphaera sp.]|nr:hypothetical protein [Pedosphaera sp.]
MPYTNNGGTLKVTVANPGSSPTAAWLPVLTNGFDNSGNFNATIPNNPTTSAAFHGISVP